MSTCVRVCVHAFTSGYISYALAVKSTERTRPSSSKTVLYSLMQVDLLLSPFVGALFVLIKNFIIQFKRFRSEYLLSISFIFHFSTGRHTKVVIKLN